jgi:acyl-CoA synthetase (AMP-forming)/AMP-acid ligase II
MIVEQIQDLCGATDHISQPAIVGRDGIVAYEQLLLNAAALARNRGDLAGKLVAVTTTRLPEYLVALLALDQIGANVLIASDASAADLGRADEPAIDVVECWDAADIREFTDNGTSTANAAKSSPNANEPNDAECGSIVLFTSGTSGPPKPAVHTWQSLSATARTDMSFRHRRWLLSYHPGKFAGLQVIAQSLLSGGTLVVPDELTPASIANALTTHEVEFASGTPTFWRMVLGAIDSARFQANTLRQITLGGEPVNQVTLNALTEAFPGTRISHIYASTEMGVCFSVSDGREGFPQAWLEDAKSLPCDLRVAGDGELLIRSKNSMRGYLNKRIDRQDWFGSGDLVEVRGDRVVFAGRKSDTINVGGMKVQPLVVEAVIRSVPGVVEVRVYGVKSSMTGQLVAAEVQPDPRIDAKPLRGKIMRRCREKLAKHAVPAIVQFVEQIAATAAGKLSRTGQT